MSDNTQGHDSQHLAQKIAELSASMKADDIRIIDLRNLTSFTDFFVICSGQSDRQVQAIADTIHRELKQEGVQPVGGIEGYDSAQWILLDYGDVVAHVMYPAAREFYQIEKMWADAPQTAYAEAS